MKLLVLVAVIAAGFVLAKFTPLGTYLSKEGVLGGIEQLRGSPWAPVIFVSAYAAATAFAIPGTVLTLAGGALFGVWFGILLNS
ncbi:MAG: putative membrane protein YdjX (TVP38/TMEM64 family), partial [Myxococcota bacterium]